ncbi:transposase [Rhodococcus sp. BP22]|uniref:transposase n=1 Tax=Rhodococcus sp. BP22 TaxID=2758566 RepID=UPI001645B794
MSRKRRSFTTEYKVEAARRVIDFGRTIAEVARELGTNEALLGRWVAAERPHGRRRHVRGPDSHRSRTHRTRQAAQTSLRTREGIAFGEKASAYFAAD